VSVLRHLRRVVRHPITHNALALHGVQVGMLLVPLVTLPYTSRVLGSSAFGLVVFSQSLSFILGLLIAWGFDSWGTRDVAQLRDDRVALGRLVAHVLTARLLLSGAAALVAVAILFASSAMRDNPEFVVLAWLAAVANGIAPTWFFVGVERLRLVSAISLAIRCVGAGLTFVLVHGPDDAWIVMALFVGASAASAAVQLVLLMRMVDLGLPRLGPTLGAIRSASALFISTAALTLYTALNVAYLGFLATTTEVAHYGAAERIVRSSIQVLMPAGLAIFPRITYLYSVGNRARSLRLLFIGGGVLLGVAALLALALVVTSSKLIELVYGSGFSEAADVLRPLALVVPIGMLTSMATTWLIVTRRDHSIVIGFICGGLLNLALAPVLVDRYGARGMAISVVAAEATVALTMALICLGVIAPRKRDRSDRSWVRGAIRGVSVLVSCALVGWLVAYLTGEH